MFDFGSKKPLFLVTLTWCLLIMVESASAQDSEQDLGEMREMFLRVATQFQVGTAEGNVAFKLLPRPVSNWSNAERQTSAGGMFLWTWQGRPQVAMCVYPKDGGYDHEFQSLSTKPISGTSDRLNWKPNQAGVEFQTISGQEPGGSHPVRLRQMRNLAREFSAKLVHPTRGEKLLRLQTTPVYRYELSQNEGELVDGALFTFVQGTDPEVVLMIEAVKEGASAVKWQYALARMTMVPTEVRHKNELIWKIDWARIQPHQPYYVLRQR